MSFCDDEGVSNESSNPTFESIARQAISRRTMLGGLGAAASFTLLGCASDVSGEAELLGLSEAEMNATMLRFKGISVSAEDAVRVPPGYVAEVLYAWGDPVSGGPAFAPDASNTAAEQAQQAGMHHDGIHYFPLSQRRASEHGLLVMNHEYTDDGLLHVGGMVPWTAEKVAKSKAAHGVSVIEVIKRGGKWSVVRPSNYGRRITGDTPCVISGPVAGHRLMKTAADSTGKLVLGTLNNCAHGFTPWGTYLACEENWNGYFGNANGTVPDGVSAEDKAFYERDQKRYGLSVGGFGYRWHEHDERFDASKHPSEPCRFGWVTEIDPFSPSSTPVKRTALGRFKHEGAWVVETSDRRVVVYSGDDERFEYIYKYVSKQPWPRVRRRGASPLDEGTLYVAKFNADGSGTWLELTHGKNGLTETNGFASQADVLLETRRAADVAGATKMDRPEWISSRPGRAEVYCTLTNNSQRGGTGRPGTDAPNPRPSNVFGHIIRWSEQGNDFAATAFSWEIFVLAGDPANPDPNKQGNIVGDVFGSPDGLWFDRLGRMWIQTDVSTSVLNTGDYANIGNNQMLVANPLTREIRRFLTGPKGCEVTGVIATPDMRTLFVNIQHPGEPASERNDPSNPKAVSTWPDGAGGERPRSGTVVIRKADGGIIGT
jgi:secreted PhoX family phosphatase